MIDLKQETINFNEENLENLFSLVSVELPGYLATWLSGYLATWLPIVPYCVEWAIDGISIVGSLLEAQDKSRLNNNWKCV